MSINVNTRNLSDIYTEKKLLPPPLCFLPPRIIRVHRDILRRVESALVLDTNS